MSYGVVKGYYFRNVDWSSWLRSRFFGKEFIKVSWSDDFIIVVSW